MNGTELAEIFFQAALSVNVGETQSVRAALYKATKRLHPDSHFMWYRGAMERSTIIFGQEVHRGWDYNGGFNSAGGGARWWLSPGQKHEMIMMILFMYEYCVQEMSGDRVKFETVVSQCTQNDDQTVVL